MKSLPGPSPSRRPAAAIGIIVAIVAYAVWSSGQDAADADGLVHSAAATKKQSASKSDGLSLVRRMFSPERLDLFASQSWYIAPAAPESLNEPGPAAPTAPPLPYAFLGSYAQGGDSTTFFLVKDDRVYDVHVGDTLDNLYSVDDAANGSLEFTYLPLQIKQTLPTGDTP